MEEKKGKSTTIMALQTERMLTFATEVLKCKKTAFQKKIDIKLPFYFSGIDIFCTFAEN